MIPSPIRDSIVGSCVNVITLKVKESEVGFPIKVFGTVVARDQVDYRCVYLFRRERDDPQLITSAVCICASNLFLCLCMAPKHMERLFWLNFLFAGWQVNFDGSMSRACSGGQNIF